MWVVMEKVERLKIELGSNERNRFDTKCPFVFLLYFELVC